MVRPSRRREMAKKVVAERGDCIRVACVAFSISESCYRYERKLDVENVEVANWLIRLTDKHRNWGFGLSYLYLRNVKGFNWNYKRVYRIYKELELNLRIKPRKRLVREKPEVLTVPQYKHGHKVGESGLNTFNLVSLNKTLVLNGSIGQCGTNGCHSTIGLT